MKKAFALSAGLLGLALTRLRSSNSRRLLKGACAAALACAAGTPIVWADVGGPSGPEFRVNAITGRESFSPAVASSAKGDFVVVWAEASEGDQGSDIHARRYRADGAPRGGEFLVNSWSYGDQPAVAMNADGAFVIVWYGGFGSGIRAQRYAADGAPLGGEFIVNTNQTNNVQSRPAIGMNARGESVVVWQSISQDGDDWGVFARRYAADGSALGNEFGVNTTTDGYQYEPSVAVDADGGFVVAWAGADGQRGVALGSPVDCINNPPTKPFCWPVPNVYSLASIYAQRFTASGERVDGEFRVNSTTQDHQVLPVVAMAPAGDFVVIWQSDGQDDSGWGIYSQRYAADGSAHDGERLVNTTTTGRQEDPAVAMGELGDYVVAWQSDAQDGDGFRIFAQRYSAIGAPVGDEFLVSSGAAESQTNPALAMNSAGGFVAAWTSIGQDGAASGIYAQRYAGTTPENKVPAVVVTESGGSTDVTEGGGGDGYEVVLLSQPAADVTVIIHAGEQLEAIPSTLTFSPSAFDVPHVVMIFAVDDAAAQGTRKATVSHVASSDDQAYDGNAVNNVLVTITDNDAPGVSLHETDGATDVTEGGAGDSYEVVLHSQPGADVTVTIHAGEQLEAVPSTLTFTPSTFDVPQVVMIFAVDDAAAEGTRKTTVSHVVSSTDETYDGITLRDVLVAIADNDHSDVPISEAEGTAAVAEGGGSPAPLLLSVLGAIALCRTLRRGRAALFLSLAATTASADPPYGADFDAPPDFGTAVLIQPSSAYYAATFDGPADLDFYRFSVVAGQDIRVTCKQWVVASRNGQSVASAPAPCAVDLIDPAGVPRGLPSLQSDGTAVIEAADASAGEWRLGAAGTEELGGNVNTYCWPLSLLSCPMVHSLADPPAVRYAFSVTLSTSGADLSPLHDPGSSDTPRESDSGGAGSLSPALLVLLTLVGLRHAMRRSS